jgi:hypothetical protein
MAKVEPRSLYVVTRLFTAFKVQSGEGFAPEPHPIEAGRELSADLNYWSGRLWEGIVAVQFFHGDSRLYVDRETFVKSTLKKNP